GEIKRVDIREPPGLVLSVRIRQRLTFRPGGLLLLAEPRWELGRARPERTRQDRAGRLQRFGLWHSFVEDGCLIGHTLKTQTAARDRRCLPLSWGRNLSRPNLPSQARSGGSAA